MTRNLLRVAVVAWSFVLAGPAAAQGEPVPHPGPSEPAADTLALARDAFRLGTQLANREQWSEALAAFEESSRLHPHPVTTYNIAYSERALGHHARAYALFQRCLAEHEAKVSGALTSDLSELAQGYSLELDGQIAHAFVEVKPSQATVTVDGRPLEPVFERRDGRPVLVAAKPERRARVGESPARFELVLDPGQHVLVVSLDGAPARSSSIDFDAGSARSLELSTTVLKIDAPPRRSSSAEATRLAPQRTWAYVAFGVAGAALSTGAVFGILAANEKSFLDGGGRCKNGVCPPEYKGDVDAAYRDAAIATAGLGVGIAGAALGTYLWLSARPTERAPVRARIEPLLGPSMLGARGSF
jgi:hypothetical protein